jgi:hypothetical protein
MTLKNLFRVFQDGLSGFGVAILALYGWETTVSGTSTLFSFQHRWVGYVILISALVVANRVRLARKAGA